MALSVTVSMAAETNGIAIEIFLVSFVFVTASRGSTLLARGLARTSSNVKASTNEVVFFICQL